MSNSIHNKYVNSLAQLVKLREDGELHRYELSNGALGLRSGFVRAIMWILNAIGCIDQNRLYMEMAPQLLAGLNETLHTEQLTAQPLQQPVDHNELFFGGFYQRLVSKGDSSIQEGTEAFEEEKAKLIEAYHADNVAGEVPGMERQGSFYRLVNGRKMEITREEMEARLPGAQLEKMKCFCNQGTSAMVLGGVGLPEGHTGLMFRFLQLQSPLTYIPVDFEGIEFTLSEDGKRIILQGALLLLSGINPNRDHPLATVDYRMEYDLENDTARVVFVKDVSFHSDCREEDRKEIQSILGPSLIAAKHERVKTTAAALQCYQTAVEDHSLGEAAQLPSGLKSYLKRYEEAEKLLTNVGVQELMARKNWDQVVPLNGDEEIFYSDALSAKTRQEIFVAIKVKNDLVKLKNAVENGFVVLPEGLTLHMLDRWIGIAEDYSFIEKDYNRADKIYSSIKALGLGTWNREIQRQLSGLRQRLSLNGTVTVFEQLSSQDRLWVMGVHLLKDQVEELNGLIIKGVPMIYDRLTPEMIAEWKAVAAYFDQTAGEKDVGSESLSNEWLDNFTYESNGLNILDESAVYAFAAAFRNGTVNLDQLAHVYLNASTIRQFGHLIPSTHLLVLETVFQGMQDKPEMQRGMHEQILDRWIDLASVRGGNPSVSMGLREALNSVEHLKFPDNSSLILDHMRNLSPEQKQGVQLAKAHRANIEMLIALKRQFPNVGDVSINKLEQLLAVADDYTLGFTEEGEPKNELSRIFKGYAGLQHAIMEQDEEFANDTEKLKAVLAKGAEGTYLGALIDCEAFISGREDKLSSESGALGYLFSIVMSGRGDPTTQDPFFAAYPGQSLRDEMMVSPFLNWLIMRTPQTDPVREREELVRSYERDADRLYYSFEEASGQYSPPMMGRQNRALLEQMLAQAIPDLEDRARVHSDIACFCNQATMGSIVSGGGQIDMASEDYLRQLGPKLAFNDPPYQIFFKNVTVSVSQDLQTLKIETDAYLGMVAGHPEQPTAGRVRASITWNRQTDEASLVFFDQLSLSPYCTSKQLDAMTKLLIDTL